jgi:hypothetical protein
MVKLNNGPRTYHLTWVRLFEDGFRFLSFSSGIDVLMTILYHYDDHTISLQYRPFVLTIDIMHHSIHSLPIYAYPAASSNTHPACVH